MRLLAGRRLESTRQAGIAQLARSGNWVGHSIATGIYESLGDFSRAETHALYVLQDDWFYWCKATGHGNIEDVRKRVWRGLRIDDPRATISDLADMGRLLFANEDLEGALKQFQESANRPAYKGVYDLIYLAMIADRMDNNTVSNDALKRAEDFDRNSSDPDSMVKVARFIRQHLRDGTANLASFEDTLTENDKDNLTSVYLFLGLYFDNCGDADLATKMFMRSYNILAPGDDARHLARIELYKRGAAPWIKSVGNTQDAKRTGPPAAPR